MKFNSIKFDISILYTAILGIILIVFSSVLYLFSIAFLNQTDQQLINKAQAIDLTVRSYLNVLGETPEGLAQAVNRTISVKTDNFLQFRIWKITQRWSKQIQYFDLNNDYIDFFSKEGKEVFSSPNLDKYLHMSFREDIQLPRGVRFTLWTLNTKHKNIRVINYLFMDRILGPYLLQVGEVQDPLMQQLRSWIYAMAVSIPLILLLTNFVGRILANRILKPVYEITDLAKQITQHDLSGRIKTKHFNQEMSSLVESFNDMIARLEQSFKHIEQFSHHVAHELKTPLTIIQGEANLLLRRDRHVYEYKQALRIIMEESQRVLKTIDDLLLLTKLGYQQEVFRFEQFDFIEFLNEIIEQNRLMAANKGIGIRMNVSDLASPLMINADRLHLRRLFFNIIDNAIKFTPEGGCVDMFVERGRGKVITFISDTGPGIVPEKLAKIFDQFYRPDDNNETSGLGLNIAYTIVKLHQGDIRVESQVGRGTTFRIVLPIQN